MMERSARRGSSATLNLEGMLEMCEAVLKRLAGHVLYVPSWNSVHVL